MKCPRCYTEVQNTALKCVRCGFITPAGQHTSKYQNQLIHKSHSRKTLFLNKLKKIKIKARILIPSLIAVLIVGTFTVYKVLFNKCLTCARVSGIYTGTIVISNQKANVEIKLMQDGTYVSGSALLKFQEGENAGKRIAVGLLGSELSNKHVKLSTTKEEVNQFLFDTEITENGLNGETTVQLKNPTLSGSKLSLVLARKN